MNFCYLMKLCESYNFLVHIPFWAAATHWMLRQGRKQVGSDPSLGSPWILKQFFWVIYLFYLRILVFPWCNFVLYEKMFLFFKSWMPDHIIMLYVKKQELTAVFTFSGENLLFHLLAGSVLAVLVFVNRRVLLCFLFLHKDVLLCLSYFFFLCLFCMWFISALDFR